ncbi:hypothetical protein [Crocosphaera sp. XPORK-15E]|uniref:hypothetical protein n=1 Tax=Crocosphaera sp. XPORK-15E TaxID=3110247 RepID=UPI002B20E165|nr:hypothetical protein [Crocosphaera sp. XPORK-15E]MEA5535622.1 hypothetical protein [Crocosphaera sp. XPORK-15E]
MLTGIREFVANKIENRGRFLSSKELTELEKQFKQDQVRLEAAQGLHGNINQLKEETVGIISQKFLVPSGSNSQEDLEFVRNIINWMLVTITYAILAEDTNILDENVLNGLQESLYAQNHSPDWYIEALNYIKIHHGLKDESKEQVNTYIDYLISALNSPQK